MLKVDVEERLSEVEKLSGGLGDVVCMMGIFIFPKRRPKRAELIMKILNKTKVRETNTL